MKRKIIIGIVIVLLVGSGFSLADESLANPPNIPSEPNPEDGAIDVGIKTHLSWTGGDSDPGDKATYDLYFGTEPEPELLSTDLQMPNYHLDTLEINTQYYWKIIARDESQAETTGSIWTFTTNDCDCNPPDQPSGPVRARNRNQYEYTTKLMIQNQNGLYYNFSWGDGNCSGWLGPYNHNERVRAEHQWQEPGEYQVQSRARFYYNGSILSMDDWITTGWSEPLLVTVTSEDVGNEAPKAPTIIGTTNGKVGVDYDYTFSASDLDGDNVYIYVEFCADCQEAQWYGPFPPGYQLTISYSWESQGVYTVKAKAKDVYDAESDWATLEVSMPKNKPINTPFLNFLENHPYLFPLLRQLLGL
ncbi:MAG: hypothetical protein ACTSQ3_05650 [Candidatus Heimdallarchaeota archaeon]